MFWTSNTARGLDIADDGIRWAETKGGSLKPQLIQSACGKIPEGLVKPSFAKENIIDKEALRARILETIPAGKRRGDIALSLPDNVAKVFLIDFDDLPSKREDIEQLVRWRLKKILPLPAETVKVDCTILEKEKGKVELLVIAASKDVVREYEDVVRSVGLRPKVVNIASLNAFLIFHNTLEKNSVFVNLSADDSIGITVLFDGKPAFFRSKEVGSDIEKIERELVSTLTYYKSKKVGLPVNDIYLFCDRAMGGGILKRLEKGFDGNIHRLDFPEAFETIIGKDEFEKFAAAIGAAMRL